MGLGKGKSKKAGYKLLPTEELFAFKRENHLMDHLIFRKKVTILSSTINNIGSNLIFLILWSTSVKNATSSLE